MMRFFISSILLFVISFSGIAQQDENLPNQMLPKELIRVDDYRLSRSSSSAGITTPPNFPVRTMAEWEEVQTLVLTWTNYTGILKRIVREAILEVEVIIICNNSNDVINFLNGNSAGGPISDLSNIVFLEDEYNSIWMRDYGSETIYRNDVDTVMQLDWIYNRPRPEDDIIPDIIADYKNIPIYNTTQAPNDLVHTGGNFMADGFGTAFSSKLVLDENGPGGQFNVTVKTELEVKNIMFDWMGIDPDKYILMETLPFDGIHHIDMHMKLLDEETLLVGEFPAGLSDGPQLEANLQYVLSNFNSVFGTPFKVVRIPMPPSTGGNYAPQAYYRTFTNSIFINKTVLVPTYRTEYDTTGMRIMRELLPGYKIVGIDCDNAGSNIISSSGALHCISKTIGVDDPLLMSHQRLEDTYDDVNPYLVEAFMKHRSGVSQGTLYWTTDTTASYNSIVMTDIGNDTWSASIPAQAAGSEVFYYVHGTSNSGKEQVRPIVAPEGYWNFDVLGINIGIEEIAGFNAITAVYPNPASAITAIEIDLRTDNASLRLIDVMGQEVEVIHQGDISGEKIFFIDASRLSSGVYIVSLETGNRTYTQRLVVK